MSSTPPAADDKPGLPKRPAPDVRDPVTGLIGRKLFDLQLEKDVSHVRRHHEPLAIMLVEISNARPLFAELGQARSNSLLKMAGSLLGKSIRKEDTLARISESVFALSLPTAKPAGAADLSRRMLQAFDAIRLKNKGKPLELAVSIGVLTIEAGQGSPADVLFREIKNVLGEARARKSDRLFILQHQPGKPFVKTSGRVHVPKIEVPAPAAPIPALTPAESTLSVDQVLERHARGEAGKAELLEAIRRIRPLLKLLSPEQLAALLK